VDIRFWGDAGQRAPLGFVGRVLRQLGDAAETGVLFLRAAGETDSEIHLRDGHVVGCRCIADEWLLARRLVGAGLLDSADLQAISSCETPLHEAVDEFGLVEPVVLHRALAERFRDTFHFACATSWRSIEFLRLGSLLLPPSAPGVVPGALLMYVDSWRREVGDVLERLRRAPEVKVVAGLDPRSLTGEAAVVLTRMVRPTSLAEVVATSPIERYRTLAVIARMEGDGCVLFEDAGPAGSDWPSVQWNRSIDWGVGVEGDRDGSAVMMEEE